MRVACDTLAPLFGELPYDLDGMPPAFHVALLDDLLATPRQALERLLDRKVEISALTESYAAQEGDYEIAFTLEIGRPAARLLGVLAGSPAFFAACVTAPLATAARIAARAPSAAVPLRCDLLAGRMTLSVEEWRSLRPGDVLLAERTAGSATRPGYGLVVGGVRLAMWNATRSGEQMMVEDNAGAATMPQDETPGDDSPPESVTDIGALPVRLEFFAGAATMRLDRLAALRPGHVFEMPDALRDGAVDIRVHGRVVGKGEMVAVGDRLGIRLLELQVKDDGPAA
ncbi:MAG: type III secretion system cytoplasmic ring protein SctQ [Burkholderiaceae bacterium]